MMKLILFGVIAVVIAILAVGSLFTMRADVVSTQELPNLGPAPELAGITGWINAEPFSLDDHRGKVVLVDFWTYSCINCIRTLPYLTEWHAKYADQGLVIVGVHTPEFDFEKVTANVEEAVDRYGIEYAVVQDNDFATWRAYKNNYWPRKYLIDQDGNIRYDHIGEGAYDETENAIQLLLDAEGDSDVDGEQVDYAKIGTPELYLGYHFARAPLGNPEGFVPETLVTYGPRDPSLPNIIYLEGEWFNSRDYMEAGDGAELRLIYTAKAIHSVIGGEGQVDILLDGEPTTIPGADVVDGVAVVDDERLYRLIADDVYTTHEITMRPSPGVRIYSFTFG